MITYEVISSLMTNKEILRHESQYQKSILQRYHALENHFSSDYPEEFLESTRPNEDEWMKDYRRHVWEAPTHSAISRVENLLHKIRQADDFRISFNESEIETGIPKERAFKKYLTQDMPVVGNLEDWIFQLFQKAFLSDPNSLVFIGPDYESLKYEDVDFSRPYPQIIESEQILKVTDDYVFFEVSEDYYEDERCAIGIDKTSAWIIKWNTKDQTQESIKYDVIPRIDIWKEFPIKKVGTIASEIEQKVVVWDSILTGALSSWNIALRRADDNEIIWVKYAYPKEWEISSGTCKTCKGFGRVFGTNNIQSDCKTCAGTGNISTETPFNKLVINVTKSNALNPDNPTIPVPPMGIVERPLDVIKEFRTEIEIQIERGFKALGLENLFQVPLSTSGESKIQDKKEVHTFLYQIAVVYVSMYEWVALQCHNQIYGTLTESGVLNIEQSMKALPTVTIPTEFDILSAAAIADSLAHAKDKNLGTEIINGLERYLLIKQYGENSDAVRRQRILNILDPLPNLKPDEKALYKEAGLVSELDALISVKLPAYINRLVATDPKWWDKDYGLMETDIKRLAANELEFIKAANVGRLDFNA
jgi:hypothetical protein